MTGTFSCDGKIQIGAGLSGYVADMTSAILGALLGLPEAELDNHASYLATWVKVLKNDKNAILTAASQADIAVDYIVGLGQAGATRVVEHERPLLAVA